MYSAHQDDLDVGDDDSSSTNSKRLSLETTPLASGTGITPQCFGRPRNQVVLIGATVGGVVVLLVLVGALAGALGGSSSTRCAAMCTAFAAAPVVVWEQAHSQPSFLAFSQDTAERLACKNTRALVVGGINADGWAEQWTFTADGVGVAQRMTLVASTSGLLNWPHCVSQDECSGTLFVANPQEELGLINQVPCVATAAGSTAQVAADGRACTAFASALQLLTRAFFNPLGLRVITKSTSGGGGGGGAAGIQCPDEPSTLHNRSLFVTGGLDETNSYVGKYTAAGEKVMLVPPELGVLSKVRSVVWLTTGWQARRGGGGQAGGRAWVRAQAPVRSFVRSLTRCRLVAATH
jgi:hypothetical protein